MMMQIIMTCLYMHVQQQERHPLIMHHLRFCTSGECSHYCSVTKDRWRHVGLLKRSPCPLTSPKDRNTTLQLIVWLFAASCLVDQSSGWYFCLYHFLKRTQGCWVKFDILVANVIETNQTQLTGLSVCVCEKKWNKEWQIVDNEHVSQTVLTCSAKKDMTVKTTNVTSTQWVQNFSLSRYIRLWNKGSRLVSVVHLGTAKWNMP